MVYRTIALNDNSRAGAFYKLVHSGGRRDGNVSFHPKVNWFERSLSPKVFPDNIDEKKSTILKCDFFGVKFPLTCWMDDGSPFVSSSYFASLKRFGGGLLFMPE